MQEINGKEIQISLTGFMEKNTGKFMKELWTLLISAQNNASGIPQQFLDAKEEETKKNKVNFFLWIMYSRLTFCSDCALLMGDLSWVDCRRRRKG